MLRLSTPKGQNVRSGVVIEISHKRPSRSVEEQSEVGLVAAELPINQKARRNR